MKIKFINHASYIIENDKVLLLHDPWLEGKAFNGGWALLSQDYYNTDVIQYLKASRKSIFIWISHEHSDHFNISFIRQIKSQRIKCKFLFQNTADKRVYKYLKSNNYNVIECKDGKEYKLDDNFYFSVYSYMYGDSFCFLKTNDKNILNINDCVITNEFLANKILSRLPKSSKIDVLFTQFGYANWVGREEDINLRISSAKEKIQRILIQNKVFKPEVIIPFASFVYFCKSDNFYMNFEQNTPLTIRNSKALNALQRKINFMKPMQEIEFEDRYIENLQSKSKVAENYWNKLFLDIKNKNTKFEEMETVPIDKILANGSKYINKVRLETLLLIVLFELFNLFKLKPIIFHIYDLNTSISLSYIKGIKLVPNLNSCSISIHSSEILFILKNEFGWNTLLVSGAFKAIKSNIEPVMQFFRWQDAIKNGFSFKHPFYSLKVSSRYFFKKIKKLPEPF